MVGDGYECLMTADYSQIEMRIMAHLSEDAELIEAFRSGRDFHSITAAKVFEVEPDRVGVEERAKIKAMNYGLAYGLSAFGLAQQLKIEPSEARLLMDDYFETFGGVRDYLASIVDEARRTRYTETILGRRRYLPDLTSDNRQRREMAERMALNAPIQGSAADLIKVAMLGVEAAIDAAGLRSRMLLQVHDELVFEVAPGGAGRAGGAGPRPDGRRRGRSPSPSTSPSAPVAAGTTPRTETAPLRRDRLRDRDGAAQDGQARGEEQHEQGGVGGQHDGQQAA